MRDYNGHELISPPPFFVIFRSPLRWLLSSLSSFSVVRSNYEIRYLSFHRWINAASSNWRSYAISIRYIRIPNAFLSCLFFSIFLFLSLYLFIASKTFVCAFASRTKKDRFGKSRERNAAWNRFEENEQLEEAISFFVSSSFSLSSSFSPSCSTRNKRIFST